MGKFLNPNPKTRSGARRGTGKAADAGYTAAKASQQQAANRQAIQNFATSVTTKQATGKAADSGYTVAKKRQSQQANRQAVWDVANAFAQDTKLNFSSGTNSTKTQYHPALESKLGQGKNWSEPKSPVGNLFETWVANDIASKMNAVGTVLRDDGKRQGLAVDNGDVTADSENLWYNRAGRYLQGEADRAQKIAEAAYARGTAGLNSTQKLFFDTGLAGLQMAGDLGVSAATAGMIRPSVSMATRSFGNAAMQARNAGGAHNQQLFYGGLNAAKDLGANKLFDGVGGIYGKGVTDDVVEDIASRLFKSDARRAGVRAAIGTGMEGAENVIDSSLNPVLQTIYNDRTLGDVTGIRLDGLNNDSEEQRKLALQSKMGFGDNWKIHNPISEERVSELLREAMIGGLLSGMIGGIDIAQTMNGNPRNGIASTLHDAANGAAIGSFNSSAETGIKGGQKGADYRAIRPQNVEMPYVPLIELSMNDLAEKYGGQIPAKGNYGRRDAIARARERLGLNENEAAYIPASNVTRNGNEYILKITKSTLNKMLSPADGGDVPVESLLVMDNLERIANNGIYYSSLGDRKGREHILGIDHLITSVYIDGTPMVVDMRVRVVQQERGGDSNNFLYYFTPEEISIIRESGSTSAAERQALRGEVSPLSINRITQRAGESNRFLTPYQKSGSTSAAERHALRGEVSPLSINRIAQGAGKSKRSSASHADASEYAYYKELERKFLDGTITKEEGEELWRLEGTGKFGTSSETEKNTPASECAYYKELEHKYLRGNISEEEFEELRKLENIWGQFDAAVKENGTSAKERYRKLEQKFRNGNISEEEFEELRRLDNVWEADKYTPYRGIEERNRLLEKQVGSGIMKGAKSGALNPESQDAKNHAERYYNSVRKMTTDVQKIALNTGFSVSDIQNIKNFIFYEEHELDVGVIRRFYPSYEMAESWQRLVEGKRIMPHDITLLRHELLERSLMAQGLTQEESHIIASEKYDYGREARVYYDQIERHKK